MSAPNCILALLLPRVDYLVQQNYGEIKIVLDFSGETREISSKRTGSGCLLYVDGNIEDCLSFYIVEGDENAPSPRSREIEQAAYRDQLLRNTDHKVLKFIRSLPNPMFLGLDRRSLSYDEGGERFLPRSYSLMASKRRNIFSQSLSQSLVEAMHFAFESYRRAQRNKEKLSDQLRVDLVLDLIAITPARNDGKISFPPKNEVNKMDAMKKSLRRLPELLQISEDFFNKKTDIFFKFIDETQLLLKELQTINFKSMKEFSNETISALIRWDSNKYVLDRVSSISDRIIEYNKKIDTLFAEGNAFIRAINLFMSDSGKRIEFDSVGELIFYLPDDVSPHDLRELSSGEVQLIVILAHLHFNPEVKKAGVFIIDEPELSLHVEWQEKFVDTIMQTQSDGQIIMATHSPSIILNRVDKCIDLSAGVSK